MRKYIFFSLPFPFTHRLSCKIEVGVIGQIYRRGFIGGRPVLNNKLIAGSNGVSCGSGEVTGITLITIGAKEGVGYGGVALSCYPPRQLEK